MEVVGRILFNIVMGDLLSSSKTNECKDGKEKLGLGQAYSLL